MDNYATHKTPKIKAWLARRPHWYVHFTPTSASWINQVERWFAELTRKQLQRGADRSTAELEADINAFIKAHNESPAPYKWVKSADQILASVKRFCQPASGSLIVEEAPRRVRGWFRVRAFRNSQYGYLSEVPDPDKTDRRWKCFQYPPGNHDRRHPSRSPSTSDEFNAADQGGALETVITSCKGADWVALGL